METVKPNNFENGGTEQNVFSTKNAPRCVCDYASVAQLRTYVKGITNEGDIHLLQSLITRYSRLLDTACQVEAGYFDTANRFATAKRFYANYSQVSLHIGSHVQNSIECVKWNGLDINLNNIVDDGENITIAQSFWNDCVRSEWGIYSDGGGDFGFDTWLRTRFQGYVEITARWGVDNIRHDVTEAVLSMAVQAYRRREPLAAVNAQVGAQPFVYSNQTVAWKTVVESETRNRRWNDFRPA